MRRFARIGGHSYTAVVPRRRERRVDPYPGPDAVWLFLLRNRRQFDILLFAVILLGATYVLVGYSRPIECPGTEAERTVVADLRNDPLLNALPPAAAKPTSESTMYLSCPTTRDLNRAGRLPRRPTLPVAIETVKQYGLANPMTVVELHDHHVASVGHGGWRLTHTDAHGLSYCRMLRGYRLMSVMTLDDRWLTIRVLAWTDGAPCGAEVALTR